MVFDHRHTSRHARAVTHDWLHVFDMHRTAISTQVSRHRDERGSLAPGVCTSAQTTFASRPIIGCAGDDWCVCCVPGQAHPFCVSQLCNSSPSAYATSLTFHSQDSCAALRMLREVVLAVAWCSGTKGIRRAYDDERLCSQIFGHAAIVTCTALARRLSSIARCTVAYVGSGIRGPLTDGPIRFIFCGPRFASLEILAAHG